MKCGYCTKEAIAWMEWKTIGRPKCVPVCEMHKTEHDKPDNFGEHPTFTPILGVK